MKLRDILTAILLAGSLVLTARVIAQEQVIVMSAAQAQAIAARFKELVQEIDAKDLEIEKLKARFSRLGCV